jgi:ABC-type branched-subunit amino acid transport system substrate-binding protein
MTNRKYSSYSQIDKDLVVLAIEKEINYQKLILGFKQTKDNLVPQSIVTDLISKYASAIPYGPIVSTAVPFVLNKIVPAVRIWFKNKKRGG